MHRAGKITSIIVLLILANVMFANFAFAQTPAPPAPPPAPAPATPPVNTIPVDKLIQKGEWEAATTQEKCSVLAEKIRLYTANDAVKYTTVFKPDAQVEVPSDSIVFTTSTTPCLLYRYVVDPKGNRVPWAYQSQTDSDLQNRAYTYLLASYEGALQLPPNFFSTGGGVAVGTPDNSSTNYFSLFEVLAGVIAKIIDVINVGLGAVAALAGKIFELTIAYARNAPQPKIVTTGWTIMRDLMNLAFVLSIIGIALATILRIENYGYKKLLGRLILMALLINFSKVIGESIISLFDTLIITLTNGADWSILFKSSIGYLTPDQLLSNITTNGGHALVTSLVRLILSIGMAASFLAIAALLVIRMVSLWFLLMVSPIAYALRAFPSAQAQGYAKQWWSTFIKYLIWAPVSIFFLRLTVEFVKNQDANKVTGGDASFGYILVLAMMWGSVLVAKQSGLVGANAITGMAEKATKWGSVAAARYGLRGTGVRHAGVAAGWIAKKATLGKFNDQIDKYNVLKKGGEKLEKGTAYIEGIPSIITEPLARNEKARQKKVADASRDAQLRLGMYGTFADKDAAATLGAKDLYGLADRGALNPEKMENLLDNNPKANETFLLAMKDGKLGNNLPADQKRKMYEQVYKSHFLSHGGQMDQVDLARRYYYDDQTLAVAPEVKVDSIKGAAYAQDPSKGADKRKAYVDPAALRIVRAQSRRQANTAAGVFAGGAVAGAAAAAVVRPAGGGRRRAGFAPNQPQNQPQQPPQNQPPVNPPPVNPRPAPRRGPPPTGRGTGNFRQAPGFVQNNPAPQTPGGPPAANPGPTIVAPPRPVPPPQASGQQGSGGGSSDAAAVALTAAAVAQAKAAQATKKSAEATVQAAKASADALKNAAEVQKESARQTAGTIRSAAEQSRADLSDLSSEIASANSNSDRLTSAVEANTQEIKNEDNTSNAQPDLTSPNRTEDQDLGTK